MIYDERLYIIREREYYESARGQAIFAVTKSELDTAEKDINGIIREEATRVLCLSRDPKKYMEVLINERYNNGDPIYPSSDVRVSAPKQEDGSRVVVEGVTTDIMIRDLQNGGMLQPLRDGDIVTRGGGLANFLVKFEDGRFVAKYPEDKMPQEILDPSVIRAKAYRKIGTLKETPELINDQLKQV